MNYCCETTARGTKKEQCCAFEVNDDLCVSVNFNDMVDTNNKQEWSNHSPLRNSGIYSFVEDKSP